MTFMQLLVKNFTEHTSWDFAVFFGSIVFISTILIVCSPRRPRSER